MHDAGRRVDVSIDFPVSQQDIAQMTATTLYTVSRSRMLSAWEKRGIVRSGRQRITLTKPHALMAIAEDLREQ